RWGGGGGGRAGSFGAAGAGRAPAPPPAEGLEAADLGEADHRHGVLRADLAVVELPQEGRHLLRTTDLRVVVLDLPRRELAKPLHLDLVDHGVEDPVARPVPRAAE